MRNAYDNPEQFGITELTHDMADSIINGDQKYSNEEGLYFVVNDDNSYTGIDDSTWNAWTEDFTDFEKLIDWLLGDNTLHEERADLEDMNPQELKIRTYIKEQIKELNQDEDLCEEEIFDEIALNRVYISGTQKAINAVIEYGYKEALEEIEKYCTSCYLDFKELDVTDFESIINALYTVIAHEIIFGY